MLITCPWVAFFLASVRNLLQPSPEGRLFPYSYVTFIRRWQQTLQALHLPLIWTPAGLRAGGATWLYRIGLAISFIRLRGRWRSPSSLETYIQEAAAFAVMQQIPLAQREAIRSRARILWTVVKEALEELYDSVASGRSIVGQVDLVLEPHPIMRRLLRRRKLEELRAALAAANAAEDD